MIKTDVTKIKFQSDFLNFLQERGLLYQCSSFEKLDNLLHTEKITAYIGFDCTAPSLHVGSLIQILLLKYLQKFGHSPIVLLGGGTTLVGDPSGKDDTRKLITTDNINNNLAGIKNTLSQFISFEGSNSAKILNNAKWLTKFNYLDFLREYGKDFTINRMLTFDSVKSRLDRESSFTFLEFNYMLLQAVDFYYLYKHYNVKLQLGGSDQWGNIINGVEIIRRKAHEEAFGLTSPLLTKADGTKMGKTATGAVWLNKDLFSVNDFYQFFRNTHDDDVIQYLKMFTEIPLTEIKKLSKLQGNEINEAKKILAFKLTELCHGLEAAKQAEKLAINVFEKKELDTNLPTYYVTKKQLLNGLPLVQFLVEIKVLSSNSEGRKLIQNNGLSINTEKCTDIHIKITNQDLQKEVIQISIGKKQHILIKIKG
ncbi:Tyrosine--tRNA ligase 1 [Candidatus Hepatincola sp. Av]